MVQNIISFTLAVILVPLHAYFCFNLAFPEWLRAPIFRGGIKTGILTGLDLAGLLAWGKVGFIIYKWIGIGIFVILYLVWGWIWYWRGFKKLAELRSKAEFSKEFQESLKELERTEKESEDGCEKE